MAVLKLEKKGHRVTVVSSGREALAALAQQAFDVVLTDIQMPDMDGLEMTAALRREERQTGQHLPIIAMTAHAMKGDRERCLAAGMDGYVAKPIQDHELWRALRDAVRDRPLVDSHEAESRGQEAPETNSPRPRDAGLDLAPTAAARPLRSRTSTPPRPWLASAAIASCFRNWSVSSVRIVPASSPSWGRR